MIEVEWLRGDDGIAMFAKGWHPFDEFIAACKQHSDYEDELDSRLFDSEPVHVWMRCCRNFQEGTMLYVDAAPNSRGAFKCTWIQEH